jgi:hypothetical protein
LPRTSADDLFARLRASRADTVAQRAVAAAHLEAEAAAEEMAHEVAVKSVVAVEVDSVFSSTAAEPVAVVTVHDSPFARRDEALTPLIVASARKLKRVLADEQNDVLHALRGKEPVRTLDAMLASETEQADRWSAAIAAELTAAAVAGAVSMGKRASSAPKEVKKFDATRAAAELLATDVVRPLRERLARCVTDADGDNAEMAALVRTVYREWKTQRIDEQLDDVARTAFGRGALVGVAPGTRICWMVDPGGPQCPDAEDNALAGAIDAGQAFPTDHTSVPAHSGCRCMIALSLAPAATPAPPAH